MSKKRVLCKFFAHGACLKGEFCEFAHDWTVPANNVCTFYQRGACSYGTRCRYEHVRVSRPLSSPSASPANLSQSMFAGSTPVTYSSGTVSGGVDHLPSVTAEVSGPNKTSLAPDKPAWDKKLGDGIVSDSSNIGESRNLNPADRPICSFAAAGNCPHGELCPHMHGDLCPTCGKHCLHPFRPQEREEHLTTCKKRQNHLEALKHSQEIECSVCLERVLSKPTAAERKFGILSECDHPFCISCIRNWRSSSPSHGMDVNSALRACPICRKLSYFVIPSIIWYSSKEEKEEIVESYRTKLRSIDCKHFDFGNGTCPFGTSCFYKHTVKPGSYMWNAALMPDLCSSSIMNREGTDWTFDREQNSALLYMFQHVYHPHTPLGMEMEDFCSEEDLDDAMTLLFWLNLVDGSGSSSDDDSEVR